MTVNQYRKAKNRREAPIMLPRLAERANIYFHKGQEHKKEFLLCCKICGNALNKARYYDLWKTTRWESWLKKNFDGSPRTAYVYMRIAKKWDDPRIVEAKEKGITIDSIRRFFEVLANKDSEAERNAKAEKRKDRIKNMTPEEIQQQENRKEITKRFSKVLNRLYGAELKVFLDNFDQIWQDTLYPEVYDITCKYSEEDFNTILLETGQLEEKKSSSIEGITSYSKITRITNKFIADLFKVPNTDSRREYIKQQLEIQINAKSKTKNVPVDKEVKMDNISARIVDKIKTS